jgi:hypothetical protein
MAPIAGSDKGSASVPSDTYPDMAPNNGGSGVSSLPLILSIIALLLAATSLYLSISKTASGPALSLADRESIRAIASDLRTMQKKEFTLSSQDTKTIVKIEKNFPISDILPKDFSVPVTLSIPVQSTVSAVSANGQVVPLRINENLTVRTQLFFDLSKSDTSDSMVSLNQEVPVSTRIRGTIPISTVFPAEFNSIVTRLEQLGADPNSKVG